MTAEPVFPTDVLTADAVDVRGLFAADTGIIQTLAVGIVSSSREAVVTRLDPGAPLLNHVGGPHAGIIFATGELAAFALLMERFYDLVASRAVPLIKNGSIAYTDLITGPFTATATVGPGIDDGVRQSYDARGVASFPVEVVFVRESDGVPCATATYTMALKRR
jgi:hypothetical protein